MPNKVFHFFDPKDGETTLAEQYFLAWLKYCKEMHNVDKYHWQLAHKSHPIQEDNSSCGVFVALIIDLCMSRQKIEFPLDMLGLRKMMLLIFLFKFNIFLFSNKISSYIVLFSFIKKS
jgi:hypothetical protein